MRYKKVLIALFLLFLLPTLPFGLIVCNAVACTNGPNYWGNNYPGDSSTSTRYQHPRDPSEYIFGSAAIPGARDYDGSHYGSHDWISDAAIRSLRDPIKNPSGFDDWIWLITNDIATNKWSVWNPNYGNSAQHHNKIRGYITYLFSTQMPDMRPKSSTSEGELSHFPKSINIPQEGLVIEDLDQKWVGKIHQHSFNFRIINLGDGNNGFSCSNSLAAKIALLLGNEAIKCIGNDIKDKDDKYKSAMKPEGAAGWLGAMTHYIADMVVPAHLIKNEPNSPIYNNAYHSWFEKQLGSLTKWNKAYGAHGGPETTYFSWDIAKVGMSGLIEPIAPDIAITIMALNAIRISYRTDGNYQHIEWNGYNDKEAMNSGLYLINSDNHWDWQEDLETYGRNTSPHKYFYNKVEKLLCWATYFIACAMQYCFNEGERKSKDNQGLNPDYWVTRDPNEIPRQSPDPDPQRTMDEFINRESRDSFTDKISRIFRNLGAFISPILIGIASMMQKLFHLTGR